MPGGRGLNPKQLSRMMSQLGIKVEEVNDVEEVLIKTKDRVISIKTPSVSIMDAQGQRTWQIVGDADDEMTDVGPAEEDIELVMEQAGVGRDVALKALEAAGGEPAQAIVDLAE